MHEQDQAWPTLTSRERDVATLLVRGYKNREVARLLEIGVKTVDTHRGKVLKKTACRNNAHLTRYAIRNGFVSASAEHDAEAAI